MGKGFRKRSADNVVAEIQKWYKLGYRLFSINDDTFTSDMDRVIEICEMIISKNLDISWELRTGIRVDRINEYLLKLMKRAGCIFLAFGIESIHDDVLQSVKKGITFEQIDNAITTTEKVGIPFSGFFMIGLPGDTYNKFLKMYSYAKSKKFNEVRFYNLEPYPYTEVFDWIQKNGIFLKKPEEYLNSSSRLQSEAVFETADFRKEQKIKA